MNVPITLSSSNEALQTGPNSTPARIPLSVPNLSGNEWLYVKECLDTGWISSAGAFVNRFEDAIKAFVGAKYAIAAVNGTAALHIALQLAGVRRHDYVILPNLTFVASANAVAYIGADPLLIDVDAGNWQIDLDLLENFLEADCEIQGNALYVKRDQRRVAAIMPVHILGNLCDLSRLVALAEKFNLPLVEDSTEALGSQYRGKYAGTFGKFGTYSFNGNKIISTGGGGMIVTDDPILAKRAKHITTTAKTSSDEYFHDEVGYNYRLVNILAAIGLAQMEQLPKFLERKQIVDKMYRETFSGIDGLCFPAVDPQVAPNNWLQTIRTSNAESLIKSLRDQNVECRRFWVPMNQLPMYRQAPYVTRNDVSRKLYHECVSIPSSTNLSDQEVYRVASLITECLRGSP